MEILSVRDVFGCGLKVFFLLAVVHTINIWADTTINTDEEFKVKGEALLDRIEPLLEANRAMPRNGVMVHVGLAMKHIVSLDEHDQILTFNVRISMKWQDPLFQWNPEEYEGVDEVLLPAEDIWLPDVMLYNTVEEDPTSQIHTPYVRIRSDGEAIYSYTMTTKGVCLVDVTFFPFDVQKCPIEMGSYAFSNDVIDLQLAKNGNDTSSYLENSNWELVKFSVQKAEDLFEGKTYAVLAFEMQIARRSSIYSAYLILPNCIMNFLCIVQFLLPCDSNERVGLAITLYLSLLVYLILVESILPTTQTLPLFVIYLFLTLVQVSVAEVVTIYVLLLHYKGVNDQLEVSPWMRQYILHGLSKIVGMHQFIMSEDVKERLKAKKVSLFYADGPRGAEPIGMRPNASWNNNMGKIVTEENLATHNNKRKTGSRKSITSAGKGTKAGSKNSSTSVGKGTKAGSTKSSTSVGKVTKAGSKKSPTIIGKGAKGMKKKGSGKRDSEPVQGIKITKLKGTASGTKKKESPPKRPLVMAQPQKEIRHVAIKPPVDEAYRKNLTNLENEQKKLLKNILELCESYEERIADEQKSLVIRQEWQQVAMIIDRFMFFLFLLLNFILWLYLGSSIIGYAFSDV